MSSEISVINGVRIETDENGNQHFSIVEEEKKAPIQEPDNRNWWQKLCDWWNDTPVKPYVKVRDFNNGPDTNGENTPVNGIEVGIRIDF